MLTEAEQWELRALDARVEKARIVLGLAEAQRDQAIRRITAAHGLPETTVFEEQRDGTLVPRDPA